MHKKTENVLQLSMLFKKCSNNQIENQLEYWLIKAGNFTIDPKFKIGDMVRISKYKNVLVEGYVPN